MTEAATALGSTGLRGQRSGRSKRVPVVVSALIAAGLLIGSFLSGLFPGLGTGNGRGEGDQENSLQNVQSQVPPPDAEADIIPETPKRNPQNVVNVLIDGRSYAVRYQSGSEAEYETVGLNRIIELVAQAPGDETGIRVRITRRGNALDPAEAALRQELQRAGIPEAAVHWREQPVP